ncbi:MAG: hypothetical protein EHM18_02835 [Acidobacteria bacterium]|nr:MAG: hypothetical protein EHM18_02835 [Acidobacteriota bacterium]
MTSEATRKAERDKAAEAANAEALKIARAQADEFAEDHEELLGHTPPLERDAEHSFVVAEETEYTPEELQPDLTKTGVAGLALDPVPTIIVKADDVEHKIPLTEARLEIMSDEDIADAGLLTDAPPLVNPARVAPTSERQRTPLQRASAAGPGSWPVPEDSLPAVMPSDPPVEEGEAPGDATLSGYPPFKVEGRKVAIYSSEGVRSEVAPDETVNAAALYLRLRNQFPHFTEDMLSDEFVIQWESRVGGKQSMRPGQELSQHGDTAVGDPRVSFVELGEDRLAMDIAQPNSLPPEPGARSMPEAGLPSVNEPAVRAQDDEKFGLEGNEHTQDEVDLRAMALTVAQRQAEEEEETAARQARVDEAEEAAAAQPRTSMGLGHQRPMLGVPRPGGTLKRASGAGEAKGSAEKSPEPKKPEPPKQVAAPKPQAKPDEPKKG